MNTTDSTEIAEVRSETHICTRKVHAHSGHIVTSNSATHIHVDQKQEENILANTYVDDIAVANVLVSIAEIQEVQRPDFESETEAQVHSVMSSLYVTDRKKEEIKNNIKMM